ncbi:AraC family transcriptional regulator [Oceanicella sp. SM1341]|uniref:helix-turn-helix domain-containing protein n=1 Tax=Oceanicella sp. SM1341 TaxID=1548889 RepID=UPI000E4EDDA5|nr:AraC family transcriptional regulator [Oceanicella sp. SM1341]
MTVSAYSSFVQWYREGPLASYVRTMKSPGGLLDLVEAAQPAGDMSDPAVPDLVLYQDLSGGCRVQGNLGGGHFNVTSRKGDFFLAAPDFANTVLVSDANRIRSISFPTARWRTALEDAAEGGRRFDCAQLSSRMFASPAIRSAVRKLWRLADEEGAPSRLLAQAAGCEILAELCRLSDAPLAGAKGGLAPWAERRCLELMHSRLAEDISLDELAAEAQLSPFHFSRMFKHNLGVSPRAYMQRLRVERACVLLETTDLPVVDIAFAVGYSSGQVLARVFARHRHMSPSAWREAVCGPQGPGRVMRAVRAGPG